MWETRRETKLPDESLRDALVSASQDIIVETTLTESGLSFSQVNSKTRAFKTVMTRHIIHYLLSVNTNRSFPNIAQVFMKDHATAIHSRNVIEDLIETNREMKLKIITISTKIRNQNEQS